MSNMEIHACQRTCRGVKFCAVLQKFKETLAVKAFICAPKCFHFFEGVYNCKHFTFVRGVVAFIWIESSTGASNNTKLSGADFLRKSSNKVFSSSVDVKEKRSVNIGALQRVVVKQFVIELLECGIVCWSPIPNCGLFKHAGQWC